MRGAPSVPARKGLRCRCAAGCLLQARTRRRPVSATARASRSPLVRAARRRSGAPPARSRAEPRAGRGLVRWLELGRRLLCRRFRGGLVVLRRLSLRLGAAALAPPTPAPPRAAAALLRRGEVLGQRERNLLDRAEPLARLVEELRRARRVALRRRQKRGAHRQRQLERSLDELRGVLLVPVPARVGESAEQ